MGMGDAVTARTRGTRAAVGAVVAVAVVVALVTAGSGPAGASGPTASATQAKHRLPSFYTIPSQLPSKVPGTLIKSEQIAADGIDGRVYRVMYVSESVYGKPTVVTGVVMVPDKAAPPGGYPVVSWGHWTNGMAEQCAPSLQPSQAVPLQNQLLAKGWEVTASDYQGEGTPGLLPYLVGVVAARNTIDIVRAAGHLRAAHASKRYVVWGHSEGGQTAMFALAIGDSYAPDLHLEGVVAGAPPSQFQAIYTFLKTSPFRYYLFMAGAGFNVAYGNKAAPLGQVLTAKGLSLLPILSKGCADYVQKETDGYPLAAIVKANPFSVPAWKKLLIANDPGQIITASHAPLLIIQGGADRQIPQVTTQLLEFHECSIGQDAERWEYPHLGHVSVIPVSMSDMIHWMADRFAGRSNPDRYKPVGEAGIEVSTCAR
jgi:pimeloyl-ACP methyl ester carboxylesterase